MEKGSGLVLLDEAAAPPTPNAQLSTHLRQGFGGQASNAEVMNETEPKIEFMELWGKLQAVAARGEELAINGSLAGPTKLERRIAGLTFGVALPDPWLSQVEPSQHHRAGLVEDMPGVLRIGGSKDTQVFQWVESGNYTFARVQAKIRGRVSVSGVAMLTLGWLDAQHRHLGTTVMRLPEGEWPEWVTLVQAGAAPAGAVWVGIGIRVQHQAKDDWVEVTELSLRATKGDLKADN
jgi:hypothetical protein